MTGPPPCAVNAMVLTLLTLIAAVLDTILATVVWLRFRRQAAARYFVATIVLRTVFAFSHHVYLPAATSPAEVVSVACLRWVILPLASLCQLLFFLGVYEERWLTLPRARAITAGFLLFTAALTADVALRTAPLFGAGPIAHIDPFALNPRPALLVVFNLSWLPGIAVVVRTMVRVPSERRPLALVLAASIAGMALGAVASKVGGLGNAAVLFDVIVTGSFAYLLLRRRVFETTRIAIDKALASMVEGIAVLAEDGRVLFTNPAMEAQIRLRAGMTAAALSRQDPSISAMLSALGGERAQLRLEREEREIVLASSPILDGEGRLRGHLLLAQDITEEEQARRARDRAETASAAKSAFLAHMSHELRTPLNAILGFSQLLGRDRGLGKEPRRHLAIIERSGRHLLELINGVLDLSKIEAGKLALLESRFSPARVLADVQAMFRDAARDKGLTFAIRGASALPPAVLGDEGKVRQILINLVGNALKFTERGSVTVRASAPDLPPGAPPGAPCKLRFEVEDTGPGLDEGSCAGLFQAFSTAGVPGAGTGLGLSISRELARALGGDISVRSVLGEGSTFSFEVHLSISPGLDAGGEQDREGRLGEPSQPPPDNTKYSAAARALPAPLRERLLRAAESLSARESRAVIAEIAPDHPDLAAHLDDLVRTYRFDHILSLFDKEEPRDRTPDPGSQG